MRKILSLTLLSCLALGLISCRSIIDPTFMPSGYAYHGNEYKAAPGPEADEIGYDYSTAKNDETLAIWRIVASDLVDQLEEEAGISAQNIYVRGHGGDSAFNASYDHVLREELRVRGYNLLTYPGDALELWYEAHKPVYNNDEEKAAAKALPAGHGDFVLILNLVNDGALVNKAAGMYQLPAYGYESSSKFTFGKGAAP